MFKSRETKFMLLEDMPIDLYGNGQLEMRKAGTLIRIPRGGAFPDYDALVSEGRMSRIDEVVDCWCDDCEAERQKHPLPSWV